MTGASFLRVRVGARSEPGKSRSRTGLRDITRAALPLALCVCIAMPASALAMVSEPGNNQRKAVAPPFDDQNFTFPPLPESPPLSQPYVKNHTVVKSASLFFCKKAGAEIPGWRVELYIPTMVQNRLKLPLIVVLPVGGIGRDLSEKFARLFSKEGFLALVLNRPPPEAEGAVLHSLGGTAKTLAEDAINLRRAIDWATRLPQVDPERIGVFASSRGAIAAALVVQQDPKLRSVLALGGADLAGLYGGSRSGLVKKMRAKETARAGGAASTHVGAAAGADARGQGAALDGAEAAATGSRRTPAEILKNVDPATRPGRIDPGRTLLINARWDRVIPRASALALREAAGGATQAWISSGHYGSVLFARRVGRLALRHFERTLR